MLSKTQFPEVQILQFAFFGPFIGALARSLGGMVSDRLGGTRVTLINFVVMAVFCALQTMPPSERASAPINGPKKANCRICTSGNWVFDSMAKPAEKPMNEPKVAR